VTSGRSSKRILEYFAGILSSRRWCDRLGVQIGEVHGEPVVPPSGDASARLPVGRSALTGGVQHRHRVGIGALCDEVSDEFHRPPIVRSPDRAVGHHIQQRCGLSGGQVHHGADELGLGIPLLHDGFAAPARRLAGRVVLRNE
jgi:hypothetical protein